MNENQNPVTTNDNVKGEDTMTQEKINQIKADIENYKQAIDDAEGALAEAERELVEIYENMDD